MKFMYYFHFYNIVVNSVEFYMLMMYGIMKSHWVNMFCGMIGFVLHVLGRPRGKVSEIQRN